MSGTLFGKPRSQVVKHPGALHRDLGVPQGQKIPPAKIEAAAHGNGPTARRARLAEAFAKMRSEK